MNKMLIIAEKPKAAIEILKSPRFRGSKLTKGSQGYYGYYENDSYIVSWAMGHLLELAQPEVHDPKYKKFSAADLPIILEPLYLEKKDTKEQLDILVKLMKRADVGTIVNAADCDREGELIFREIFEYAQIEKPLKRLFLASYEPGELEAALNRLEPGEKYVPLGNAAKGRQYLDQLIGNTITRGATDKLANDQVRLASGRVQMCLLNEIRSREKAHDEFNEQTFYRLAVSTAGVECVMETEEQQTDVRPLKELAERLTGTEAEVKVYKEGERKRQAKNLYNLTDLYKDVAMQLKLNAASAKKYIQALYERGFITYPRTNSRHLPTEMASRVQVILTGLLSDRFSAAAEHIDVGGISSKHNSFNDELVTSHFAIVPTEKVYDGSGHENEQKIYTMIAQRFVAKFMPAAIFDTRELHITDKEGNVYTKKESVLRVKGFLQLFQEESENDLVSQFSIPVLQEGTKVIVEDTKIIEGKTKRPSLHTESSLLTFMETAGRKLDDENLRELMKGKRIGTVATEETFIPKLIGYQFVVEDKGRLRTTPIGAAFIETFPSDELKDPLYTAEMEGRIEQIVAGELTLEEFKEQMNQFAKVVADRLRALTSTDANRFLNIRDKQVTICGCKCGGNLIDRGKVLICSSCNMKLPKQLKGKIFPIKQIEKLMKEGKTDVIDGWKDDQGNTFRAVIVLTDGGISMRKPSSEEIAIIKCPKCKSGDIVPRSTFYGCTAYKEGCSFTIPVNLAGAKLSAKHVKQLVTHSCTEWLKLKNKEGAEYVGAIYFSDEGALKIKFPTSEDRKLGQCPLCQGDVIAGAKQYYCQKWKEGCEFRVPFTFLGKKISPKNMEALLERNITAEIKGFKKKDGSGTFDARLSYNVDEKRLSFIFKHSK